MRMLLVLSALSSAGCGTWCTSGLVSAPSVITVDTLKESAVYSQGLVCRPLRDGLK